MFPLLFALFARRKCFGVVFCLLLIESMEVRAQSSQFAFARVAEGYRNIALYPALDAGQIAFAARGPQDVWGIHVGPIGGPFARVVDQSTPIPNDGMPFEGIGDFGFDAGRVAFLGGRSYFSGLYLVEKGVVSLVADTNTPIPFSTKTFNLMGFTTSVDDGEVVFAGQSGTVPGVMPLRGLYSSREGALTRIADTTTLVPGDTHTFGDSFASPVIDGGRIVFIGNRWQRPGIYLHNLDNGVQTRVVDTNTPIPGHASNFGGFGDLGQELDMDGDAIAFIGRAPRIGGVFVLDQKSGSLKTIVENGMAIPGVVNAHFEDYFNSLSIDDGHVAFGYGTQWAVIYADPSTIPPDRISLYYGVYTTLGGALEKIVAKGDTLDGKTVRMAHVGRQGIEGDRIAMKVLFDDFTEAVYVATLIPEPGTIALVIFGCGAMAVMVGVAARQRERPRRDSVE